VPARSVDYLPQEIRALTKLEVNDNRENRHGANESRSTIGGISVVSPSR
jgi:hypothetical protein